MATHEILSSTVFLKPEQIISNHDVHRCTEVLARYQISADDVGTDISVEAEKH